MTSNPAASHRSARLVYPELPQRLGPADLHRLFSPSYQERQWAPTVARTPSSQAALLVQLKTYADLFDIRKGKRLTKEDMLPGATAFVGATDSNNGITMRIEQDPLHPAGVITVSYNGSVAEAFYQTEPFWASDDVNVFYPKTSLLLEVALFITTLIRKEKYRYNYGRKWKLETMKQSLLKLPVTKKGTPDFAAMAAIIQALPSHKALNAISLASVTKVALINKKIAA